MLADSPPDTAQPDPDVADAEQVRAVCSACAESGVGPYCHACGERQPRPEDESLAAFLRDQFHELTSADGRLWRSVRALCVPGKLTEEYFAGRRSLYVRPVRLFLVGNVLFFFVLTFTATSSIFQGRAESSRTTTDYGRWATERLAEGAATAGVTQETFDAAFDRQAETLSATLFFFLVPAFALVLAVLLFRVGASGVRHLVFSTHYLAFTLVGSVVLVLVLVPLQFGFQFLSRYGVPDPLSGNLDPILGVVFVVYLLFAVRRAYGVGWLASVAVTAGVALLGAPIILQAFRSLLFLATLWTVDVPA